MKFNVWKSAGTGKCYPMATDVILGFDWQLVATITANSEIEAMNIVMANKF